MEDVAESEVVVQLQPTQSTGYWRAIKYNSQDLEYEDFFEYEPEAVIGANEAIGFIPGSYHRHHVTSRPLSVYTSSNAEDSLVKWSVVEDPVSQPLGSRYTHHFEFTLFALTRGAKFIDVPYALTVVFDPAVIKVLRAPETTNLSSTKDYVRVAFNAFLEVISNLKPLSITVSMNFKINFPNPSEIFQLTVLASSRYVRPILNYNQIHKRQSKHDPLEDIRYLFEEDDWTLLP